MDVGWPPHPIRAAPRNQERKGNFLYRPNEPDCGYFCPTGKSVLITRTSCQAPESKIFRFIRRTIAGISLPIPSHSEGRWPSSRTRGGSRWTRRLRLTSATDAYGEGVWSRRRGAGVNAPGGNCFRGRNGGKRAVLRGEHVISRKATAQGMSDVLRCPVCSCAHLLVHIAHEIAGAARIRHSLRPLISRAKNFQHLGRNARRE
jgi:hypothetical protein